ncbi:MAG TPA: glycosyltransferase family 2 protein [Aggregatilineales bacterium]|nr:glycosyltransferase family 2 protein [Aggregatilineales bacterium]
MMDVAIIIVNWNGKDLLRRCLNAVRETVQEVSYETYVVDNHSSDGSQEVVRNEYPWVKLIANTENLGFAKANNQAMRLSLEQSRYVLLLNSDAFVKPRCIDQMVAFMDQHPEAGLGAPKLLYEDGRLQRSCYTFPTLWTELWIALGIDKFMSRSRLFGDYNLTHWNYDTVREVDVIMGAFMLARREAVQQVGLMDEAFFMYSEEVDWCYRFATAGWKTLFSPAVECIHLWGGSSQQVKVESLIRLYKARVQFARKHYSGLTTLAYKGVIALNALVRIIPGAPFYLQSAHGRQKHYAFRRLLAAVPGF